MGGYGHSSVAEGMLSKHQDLDSTSSTNENKNNYKNNPTYKTVYYRDRLQATA